MQAAPVAAEAAAITPRVILDILGVGGVVVRTVAVMGAASQDLCGLLGDVQVYFCALRAWCAGTMPLCDGSPALGPAQLSAGRRGVSSHVTQCALQWGLERQIRLCGGGLLCCTVLSVLSVLSVLYCTLLCSALFCYLV